jgi:uncharacterized protein YlxW (UPF0749 family)
MATEGERLATLETLLWEVRDDVADVKDEVKAARERLHKLEGTSSAFLNWQKDAREKERQQYQRLGRRIQVLSIIVALAAVVAPIASVLLR